MCVDQVLKPVAAQVAADGVMRIIWTFAAISFNVHVAACLGQLMNNGLWMPLLVPVEHFHTFRRSPGTLTE